MKAKRKNLSVSTTGEQIPIFNENFWRYNADTIGVLTDTAEGRASKLLEASLRPDGSPLTAADTASMSHPLHAMAAADIAHQVKTGMQVTANKYRQLVAYLALRQLAKDDIRAGLAIAGFGKERTSEIIRVLTSPEDVLKRFLEGAEGWWDTLRLARNNGKPAEPTTVNEQGAASHRATNSPPETPPSTSITENPLTDAKFDLYNSATGVPMLGVKVQVPLGTHEGYETGSFLVPVEFCTKIPGFGTMVVTMKRV